MTEPLTDPGPNMDLIVVQKLWQLWERQPPTADPRGHRIFVRWADCCVHYPSWQDWFLLYTQDVKTKELACLLEVKPDEEQEEAMFRQVIQSDMAERRCHGRWIVGTLHCEWVRSSRDGPPEPRVSDWATIEEQP